VINVTVERVAEEVDPGTIHGWNTGRLFKLDGALYFAANEVNPLAADPQAHWRNHGLIFRRELKADGGWEQIADIEPRVYTSCIDHLGRFWTASPRHFNYVTLWRSGPEMDLEHFTRCYDGTCAYLGMGIDASGNHLFIHTEDANQMPRFPNAMIAVFYEAATDSWHMSRIETPEGRFGYVGIVVRGRRAIALLQSTQLDPAAEPKPPHYNWRLLRLARCDDLTQGEWHQQPWLMRAFGRTRPSDMTVAPDGSIVIAYQHRGGDDSYEATQARPFELHIAQISDDLSVTTHEPGMDAESMRLFVGSDGRWYAVGRPTGQERLHLWRLDQADGFKPTAEWDLPGTEKIKGSVVHTLRPDRFGGEADGDTVHLVTSGQARVAFDDSTDHLDLWHARFDLPVNE